MFKKSFGFASRVAIASTVMALAVSTSVMAQSPATGLGQSWPNATDVSVSPHYHVYMFVRDGVRYIQVNDSNGSVLGAVAEAGGEVMVLPIGTQAASVTASRVDPQTSATAMTAATASTSTETVYSDSATAVTATPQSTGGIAIHVTALTVCQKDNPVDCTGSGAM
jgi:hypothetical protein